MRASTVRFFSYGLAAAVGLAFALHCLPLRVITGKLPAGLIGVPDQYLNDPSLLRARAATFDDLQHMTGLLYFLQQPWRWSLLEAPKLANGVSISLTDSNPLVAIIFKTLHPLTPWMEQSLGPYLALSYLMQPIAAVFALRGTGCRDIGSAVAIALLSVGIPHIVAEPAEQALTGHFVVLTAFGLYFRLVRHSQTPLRLLVALSILSIACLLIHPYLMLMVLAVFGAGVLTPLLRGQWPTAAASGCALGVTLLAIRLLARMIGLDAVQPNHVALYPLLLRDFLGPIVRLVPQWTWIPDSLPGVDAGVAYAGAGLIVMPAVLLLFAQVRSQLIAAIRNHGGLFLAVLALALGATQGHVIANWLRYFSLVHVADTIDQFRVSLRLIWPVLDLAMIACVRFAVFTRWRPWLLAFGVTVQLLDTERLRADARLALSWEATPFTTEQARFDARLDGATALQLEPMLACEPQLVWRYAQLAYLAARHNIAVNDAYFSRQPRAVSCPEQRAPDNLNDPTVTRNNGVVTVIDGAAF
ncbi:hypothetical protein HK28_05290 [Acetobacter sp. DsW_063]|nr:hypothetical protein HK28_05290 [Acetobacter sp. DsW_063]